MPSTRLPAVLVVLDGWGHADRVGGNAIAASRPRFMESLARDYPSGLLAASGEAVGLPPGVIGNSEVGHLCLGAGRVVLQDLTRINRAIRSGELDRNDVLARACAAARDGAALHVMGLLSDGGVHSHIDHLQAIVRTAARRGVRRLFLHAFTDGRDTPPKSARAYVDRAESLLRDASLGRIATIAGRYYAMDRDTRWDRTEKAFRALVAREGPGCANAGAAIEAAYAAGVTDEFVAPTIVGGADAGSGRDARVLDGDVVVFFNFRADRARQITRAFTEAGFTGFPVAARPALSLFVCFTAYDRTWSLPVAFPPQHLTGILGEVVSRAGLPQLRIAETEKYAHVTYFFNGGEERVFPGEERCLVPSPRIATYDLKPAMSAPEVTREVLTRLEEEPRQMVILNYANADMVGHTGRFEPTVAACRVIDASVEAVVGAALRLGGFAVVTADHGNAETMVDPATGTPVTAHTMNPVPVHVVAQGLEGTRVRERGLLSDVAPTLLALMDLRPPAEMEGRSLLEER